MAEPMRIGNPKIWFNYADDIGILGIGKNITDSVEVAQGEVDDLLGWARQNAAAFDVAKSEAV